MTAQPPDEKDAPPVRRADADVLVAQAVLAYDDERYNDALTLLERALKLDPKDARALYYKGLVYLAKKDPVEAILVLQDALELRPNDIHVQYQLGVAYFSIGDYDNAAPLLEVVYEQDPDLENLGYYIGFLRYRDKQYEKAVEAFKTNKTEDPNIQQLNSFYTGLAMGVLGLSKEAQSELAQAERTVTVSPLTQASTRVRESLAAGQPSGSEKTISYADECGRLLRR